MEKELFTSFPVGFEDCLIPESELADHRTSVDIVKDEEEDAFYFRLLEKNNIKLNANQIEAVRHVEGPLLVVAGAGSGKTSVIVSRTGYLIHVKKVQPKDILLMTFTNKAAEEMKERVSNIPGITKKVAGDIVAGTFHSIFLKLLRKNGFANKTILTSEKTKEIAIKQIMKKMYLSSTAYLPETLLSMFSLFKNNLIGPEQMIVKTQMDLEIQEIYRQYEKYKKDNRYIDFDDMLLETYHLLQSNSEVLEWLQNRFKYIFIDEYQDTNKVQYEIMKMMVQLKNNICVVGDDFQSIYGFRGSDTGLILNFDKTFASCKVVALEINYRSTTHIVGLGNEVIKHNKKQIEKTLQATKQKEYPPIYLRPNTPDEEAQIIVNKMMDEVAKGNKNYRDFAILFRTKASSRAIVEELVIREIPFVSYSSGSDSFYESPLVKPILDHLRLSLNPDQLPSIEGILATMYISKDNISYIRQAKAKNNKLSALEHLLHIPTLKSYQERKVESRMALITELKEQRPMRAIQLVRTMGEYDNYLEADPRQTLSLHKEVIKETLDELESSASRFHTVEQFIKFVDTMIKKQKEKSSDDGNHVMLMTIHGSKGLEFPVVFLIGASEGILPHKSAIKADQCEDIYLDIHGSGKSGYEKVEEALEEECRLAYVAITRAKEELYISSPRLVHKEYAEVSRFVRGAFHKADSLERKIL